MRQTTDLKQSSQSVIYLDEQSQHFSENEWHHTTLTDREPNLGHNLAKNAEQIHDSFQLGGAGDENSCLQRRLI